MGRKAKLRQQRKQENIVRYTPNWTQHTPESFTQYVEEVRALGAEKVVIQLSDRRNYEHLIQISQGLRFSVPVEIGFRENP